MDTLKTRITANTSVSDLPNPEIYHHGTKGMKWGVRRYQNKDGSLTAKGKQHRKSTTKAAALAKKGKNYVQKIDGKKVTAIISATAAVASGALWAASAFVPGGQGITFARGSLAAITAAMSLADNLADNVPQTHKQTQKHSSRK